MEIRVELNFPGKLKDEAIICNLCKKFDIVLNILEASFSTDTGWAILILHGSKEELQKAFDYLKDKGIKVEDAQVKG
jgi:ABC-type methionine transport system ATPase subunit